MVLATHEWPGFDCRHLWAEVFVGFCRCSEGFSRVFLLPQKPRPPNSRLTLTPLNGLLQHMILHG